MHINNLLHDIDIVHYDIRELNLMVKYVTFNHCNMSSNLIVLIFISYILSFKDIIIH